MEGILNAGLIYWLNEYNFNFVDLGFSKSKKKTIKTNRFPITFRNKF